MINFFTVDVEDYWSLFYRDYLGQEIPVSPRLLLSTRAMLDLLEEIGVRATCFCLGRIARAEPDLIKEIHGRGFEVASHGMDHILYFQADPEQVRRDLADSRALLEDLIGAAVRGFRAPHFNIRLDRPRLLELIVETGYQYDSSIFPFRGKRYGSAESPRGPYRIPTAAGPLLEFPLATVVIRGRRLPAGGGGYLRYFPYGYNRWAIRSLNREGLPATVYLHPYECDSEPLAYSAQGLPWPARGRAWVTNFMQYYNRSRTLSKIRALARDFRFSPVQSAFQAIPPPAFPTLTRG